MEKMKKDEILDEYRTLQNRANQQAEDISRQMRTIASQQEIIRQQINGNEPHQSDIRQSGGNCRVWCKVFWEKHWFIPIILIVLVIVVITIAVVYGRKTSPCCIQGLKAEKGAIRRNL